MNIILIILTVLAASAASFIPSSGSVYNNKNSNSLTPLKRVRLRGWITLGCYLMTIGLSIFQYYLNEKDQKEKADLAKQNQDKRDADLRKHYNESLQKATDSTIKTFVEALAVYGLKADTTNEQLIRINRIVRDSLHAKTTIIEGPDPVLMLCSENGLQVKRVNKHRYYAEYNICAEQSGVIDFKIMTHIAVSDTLGRLGYVAGKNPFSKNFKLPAGYRFNDGLTIDRELPISVLYFYISGTYKKSESGRPIPINELYSFQLDTGKFSRPSDEKRDHVIQFLKKLKKSI